MSVVAVEPSARAAAASGTSVIAAESPAKAVVTPAVAVTMSGVTVVTAVNGVSIATLLKSIHGHGPDGAACRYLGRALVGNNSKERWVEHTGAQELQAVKQH